MYRDTESVPITFSVATSFVTYWHRLANLNKHNTSSNLLHFAYKGNVEQNMKGNCFSKVKNMLALISEKLNNCQ